jgi:hypothetical protein
VTNKRNQDLGIFNFAALVLLTIIGCTDPASTGSNPICVPGEVPSCDPTATKVVQCHPTGANWMIVEVCPTNQACENGVCAPLFRGPVPTSDTTQPDTTSYNDTENIANDGLENPEDILVAETQQSDIEPEDTLPDTSPECTTNEDCDAGNTCENGICMSDDQGQCCDAWGGKGCKDNDCQDTVCNAVPSCCTTIWNTECSALAGDLCGCLGDCCLAWGGIGCSDATCQEAVCNAASTDCCGGPWNGVCAALAETECLELCAEDENDENADQNK